MQIAEIERNIDLLQQNPEAVAEPAEQILSLGEAILEQWLIANGKKPTSEVREGFRLLALHRQGAKGDPSFNACRETCRELVFQLNSYNASADKKHIMLSAMVVKHLLLFIQGKLESSELGEFCCSSKPIHMNS